MSRSGAPMFTDWTAPLPEGGGSEESALAFDDSRDHRLLVIPPLFDEHNKLRRQLVEVMRRLDAAGIDAVLPDLPGWNESTAPLGDQTVESWRAGIAAACERFGITHVLAVRGGALLLPETLPTFVYAPQNGAQLLRGMVRARSIAAREAGREEKAQDIMETAREHGIELAGWHLGAAMVRQLEVAKYAPAPDHRMIEHAEIGGTPLWLRAEPDGDAEQADALAGLIARELRGPQ